MLLCVLGVSVVNSGQNETRRRGAEYAEEEESLVPRVDLCTSEYPKKDVETLYRCGDVKFQKKNELKPRVGGVMSTRKK